MAASLWRACSEPDPGLRAMILSVPPTTLRTPWTGLWWPPRGTAGVGLSQRQEPVLTLPCAGWPRSVLYTVWEPMLIQCEWSFPILSFRRQPQVEGFVHWKTQSQHKKRDCQKSMMKIGVWISYPQHKRSRHLSVLLGEGCQPWAFTPLLRKWERKTLGPLPHVSVAVTFHCLLSVREDHHKHYLTQYLKKKNPANLNKTYCSCLQANTGRLREVR